MSDVTMTHSELPGEHITVRESSVPHYQASGWEIADEVPAPRKPTVKRRRQTGDES
ncbi:hypothetical protein [Streptomyces sp. NPDC050535]|uniref:hypothetical protein n=1 Tax=Streptomyces sp. NPDC050535 TaxID=3365626 RepID=UPI003798895F